MSRMMLRNFGTCYQFDGAATVVAVGDISSKLNLASATPPSFTLSAWMQVWRGCPDTAGIALMSGNNARMMWRSTTQTWSVQLKGGSTSLPWYNGTGKFGEWTHVGMVWDAGANNLVLYLNGLLSNQGAPADKDLHTATMNMNIGSSGGLFKGLIDNVKLSTVALNPTQMFNLFLSGVDPYPPVGAWMFDEGSGTTAIDAAGNFNGVITPGSGGYSNNVVMVARQSA